MYIRKTTQFKIGGKSKLVITFTSSDKKGKKDRTFKIQEGTRGPCVTWTYNHQAIIDAHNDAVIQRHCNINNVDMTKEVLSFVKENCPTGWN